jgi:hypothetical protein
VLATTAASEAIPQGVTLHEESDVLGVNLYSVPMGEVADFARFGTGIGTKMTEVDRVRAAVDDDRVQ